MTTRGGMTLLLVVLSFGLSGCSSDDDSSGASSGGAAGTAPFPNPPPRPLPYGVTTPKISAPAPA